MPVSDVKADHQRTMRQHAPRAESISHHAGGNLEQGVGQGEHRGHPAPPDRIDAQILLHAGAGHGDADAIDVGDGEEQDEERENAGAMSHADASPRGGQRSLRRRNRRRDEVTIRHAEMEGP
jgi:hypothetical protein